MAKAIIIGAGPAGISMAVEWCAAGQASDSVLILEKAHQHSYSIRKFYPENKLVTANYKGFEAVCTGTLCIPDLSKHETISYLDQAIQQYSLNVHYEETVWKIHQYEEGNFTVYTDKGEYTADVVIISIGILGKPNKPSYSLPASLKSRLLFDVTSTPIAGARVLVVGGGDSASEYCQYLTEMNESVTLAYRGTEFKRMNHINEQSILTLGESGKVKLLLGTDIERISDQDGFPLVFFTNGEEITEIFDYVVYALGGSTPENFLKTIGIEFNGKEPILNEGYETSVPGMFLIGDLSAGTKGGSIIWAFNSANTAMRKISEKYL
jgi:thioredoxin reductase (NADPH)